MKPADWKSRRTRTALGEVYDPDLGRHPIPAVMVPDLMERVVEDDNILRAARKVNSKPHKATGVDRKKVRQVCAPLLDFPGARERLRQQLLMEEYRPEAVRLAYIPKANGKLRRLGIATVLDRVVQRMMLQAVEAAMPEGVWSRSSFAYTHDKDVVDAIESAGDIIKSGYDYAICLDLEAFFDNVPHQRLLRKLDRCIHDRRVVRLIRRFTTPMMLDKEGRRFINRRGTPQGSVLSPLLASMLYLHELDLELEARGLRFVRYADDCTVFCRTAKAARRVKARLIEFIEGTMGCPVNKEKTKVVPVGSLSMLGLHRHNGRWCLDREKEKETCDRFYSELREYAESGDRNRRRMARDRFRCFLNHYGRIPDLADKEVPSLRRWMARRLREADVKAYRKRWPYTPPPALEDGTMTEVVNALL